jgi:hypothetical protein
VDYFPLFTLAAKKGPAHHIQETGDEMDLLLVALALTLLDMTEE